MFKAISTTFTTPSIVTNTVWSGAVKKRGKTRQWSWRIPNGAVPVAIITFGVIAGAMAIMQLYWVNSYSSKGIELTQLQNSIKEQEDLQRKLMYQQAQLNASITFADVSKTGLVPVTAEEFLRVDYQLTSR
ncbi:MAG: hypothetical protein R3B41_03510 [Candidatus Doudnabacteria bacterium]